MKLRSIALAGLLGASLLMTSGCDKDDVEKALNDIFNTSYITIANGIGNPPDFTVSGSIGSVSVNSEKIGFVAAINDESYDVYVTGESATKKTFVKDGGYLYGYCTNATGKITDVVDDVSDGVRFGIVNLSQTHYIGKDIEITLRNGNKISATVTVSTCDLTTVAAFNDISIKDIQSVSLGVNSLNVPDFNTLDPKIQDAINEYGDTAEFDLVIFSSTSAALAPLVKPKK